ncbi:MAG: hypothetical protein JJ895_10565 [Balneolaceae bacterium]|nr:hypothetical protein [Balneolaceae bacterium]
MVLDLDFANAKMIANQAVIEVNPGNHLVQLATQFDYFPARDLFIANGKTVTFYSQFSTSNKVPADKLHENPTIKPLLNKDALIVSDSNTKIYQNDTFLGTGAAIVDLQPLRNTIRFVNPNFGSKEIEVSKSTLFSVFEHYRKPQKTTAQILSTIPGLSQAYKRQYLKGAAFLVSNILAINLYFDATDYYSLEKDRFKVLVEQYNATSNEQTALELGNQIEALQSEIKDLDSRKNLLLGTSIGLYALNIFDAFWSKPKGGYRTNNFNIEFEVEGDATVRFNF